MKRLFSQRKILISIAVLLSILAGRVVDRYWPRQIQHSIQDVRQFAPLEKATGFDRKLSLTGFASGVDTTNAFVKRVVDGDTIILGTGERVRYIGVDTPEIQHADVFRWKKNSARVHNIRYQQKGDEYYGQESADFNRNLVSGKKIRLEFDQERMDKYGRTLAYVYLEDNTFVNAELIRQGYARTMTIPPNTKHYGLFKQLQIEAKAKKLGIWGRE